MPPVAQPQEVLKSLLDEAAKYTPGSVVSPFILNRWRNEAKRLTGKFPADAYYLLGEVAGFEGNEAEMRACFANALRFEPGSSLYKGSMAIQLSSFGRVDEAMALFCSLPRNLLTTEGYFVGYVNTLFLTGRFNELVNWLEETQSKEHFITWYGQKILDGLMEITSFCQESGIEDEEITCVQRVALDLLVDKGAQLTGSMTRRACDEESAWISLRTRVDRPVAEIVQLGVELSERLGEVDIPPSVEGRLVVGYLPYVKELP